MLVDTDKAHQLRECSMCGESDHWRRMEYAKETTYASDEAWKRAGTMAEKDDLRSGAQYGEYMYTYLDCVCQRDDVEPAEARRNIKQKRTEKALARCQAFQLALKHVQEDFRFLLIDPKDVDLGPDSGEAGDVTSPGATPASGMAPDGSGASPASGTAPGPDTPGATPASGSAQGIVLSDPSTGQKGQIKYATNRQLKQKTRKAAEMKMASMKQIMAPMAHILALKYLDMTAAVGAAEALQEYLRTGKKPVDDEDDARNGDALEIDFETKVWKQRAFETCEDPAKMRIMADFSDQWFSTGKVAFNVYYICKAGGTGYECNTLILSQEWDLFNPIGSTGQRYYCQCCTAGYKTKFGVCVEIIVKGKAMYCLAELPPFDLTDAKCMKIEEDYQEFKTPEALLENLPKIKPMDTTTFLRPALAWKSGQVAPGHYHFDAEMLKDIPMLNWNQLYNMRKV